MIVKYKNKRILYIGLAISMLLGCTDVFLDKEKQLSEDIFVLYLSGDGFSLCKKVEENNYLPIVRPTISNLYKNDSCLIVKVNPLNNESDTTYYKIFYNDLINIDAKQIINRSEYDFLRKGLVDILTTSGWK